MIRARLFTVPFQCLVSHLADMKAIHIFLNLSCMTCVSTFSANDLSELLLDFSTSVHQPLRRTQVVFDVPDEFDEMLSGWIDEQFMVKSLSIFHL